MTRVAAYIVLILVVFMFASSVPAWRVSVPVGGGMGGLGGVEDMVEQFESPDARYPSEPLLIQDGLNVYSSACYSCHGDIGDWRRDYMEPWPHSARDVHALITWGHAVDFPDRFPQSGRDFELSKDHPAFPSALDDLDRWAVSIFVTSAGFMTDRAESYERGVNLFESYCTSCHGPMGYGNGPLAGDLARRPRNLRDTGWLAGQSNLYIYNIISGGIENNRNVSGMPSWRDVIDSSEIMDLTGYIRGFGYQRGHIASGDESFNAIEPDSNHWTWREIQSKLPGTPGESPEYME